MKDKLNTILTSIKVRKYDEFNHIEHFYAQGFKCVKDLVGIRVFDFLNLDRNDNNCAEETLQCLYQYLHPENYAIDEGIYHGTIEQYFDFKGWRKNHKRLHLVTLIDVLLAADLNMDALLVIFDTLSDAFYHSEEYDRRQYKFANSKELLQYAKKLEKRDTAS